MSDSQNIVGSAVSQTKVTVVTGGAAGIGAAIALGAASRGPVVVCDVDEARRGEIEAGGGYFFLLDVGDRAGWHRFADWLGHTFGRVDALFLNAGRGTGRQPVDLIGISNETYDDVFAVNCHGVVSGLRALTPLMSGIEGASIVVTSSVRGLWPGPQDPVYSMTKHALIGLVRSVAPRLADSYGIRINAICPGPTKTDDTEQFFDDPYYASAPWQSTHDVARAALDVVDRQVTGEIFVVMSGQITQVGLPVPTY